MPTSKCPNHGELLGLATGTLQDDLARQLLDHVGTCSDCRAALESIEDPNDTLIGMLRALTPRAPSADEVKPADAVARAKALFVQPPEPVGIPSGVASGEPITRGQLGEYDLLAKLGEGGVGAVYKARQTKLQRIVALKMWLLRSNRGLAEGQRLLKWPAFFRPQAPSAVGAGSWGRKNAC